MKKETIKLMLEEYLSTNTPKTRCNVDSLLSMLFCCYRQQKNIETSVIRDYFGQLDTILGSLSLQQADQVVDVACKLCCEFQKEAFQNGLLVGMKLFIELQQ